jgi:hypothetical protein
MSGAQVKNLEFSARRRRILFRSWYHGTPETRPMAPARELSRLNRHFGACQQNKGGKQPCNCISARGTLRMARWQDGFAL